LQGKKKKRSVLDGLEIACYKIHMQCKHVTCRQCEDSQLVKMRKENERLKTIIEGLLSITPDERRDEQIVVDAIDALN
jgi:hypothetical protein